MKSVMKALDYFFFCRPILILAAWTVILLGAVRHRNLSLVWLLIAYSCLLGAAFILNQLRDLESDRINDKLPHLSRGVIQTGEARTLAWLLLSGALLFSLRAGLYHFAGMLLFLLITTWAYNQAPLRLKERFLAGPASLGVAAVLLFLQGNGFRYVEWPDLAAIWLAVTSICLLTEIPDREGDRQTGRRTVAVVSGVSVTLGLATALMGASSLFAWWGHFHHLALPAVCSTLLQLRLLTRRHCQTGEVNLAVRLSLLLLGLTVAVAFHWFGLLILACYLVARKYYWQRFRRHYPSFTE
ncbi:MAG: UbiA family prenyltransferase [Candidatus Delongbacteria bacterium]|nr:UbiA family prenyltransferase [Candidatus Delongbacteria bacterium]